MTVRQLVPAISIVMLVCSTAFPATAAGLPPFGVFYYSDQCIDPEGGDSSGNFVRLTRAPQGDKIEFGWSGEGPLMSVGATNVRIGPNGPNGTSKIRFSIPPTPDTIYESKPHEYIGTISTSEVRLSGVEINPRLPRRVLGTKPKHCR